MGEWEIGRLGEWGDWENGEIEGLGGGMEIHFSGFNPFFRS
jgi:hypothetical protein